MNVYETIYIEWKNKRGSAQKEIKIKKLKIKIKKQNR